MSIGDSEPSHLPIGYALRTAEARELSKSRLHKDPILAIFKAKNIEPLSSVIKDIGLEKFFVHY